MQERWRRRVPAFLFLAIASYLFLRSYVYRAPATVDVSALDLQTLEGVPFPARIAAHRAVVLNFWAPWCKPCRKEMPWLSELQQKHPEAVVVGLMDDGTVLPAARELARSLEVRYPLVQSNRRTRKAFGYVAGYPTTLYISASGKIVHTVTGIVPERVMEYYLRDTERHR